VRSGGIAVTGTATVSSHILTTSPSAADIGDATNFFQTVYAENGDFTAGAVANQYLKARKLEVVDIAGSGGFWDHRSQGSFVSNSSYTIRDNGGSRWLSALRAVSGSPLNSTLVFTTWTPALRATADGDATNDSTLPALGATGSRWSKTWTLDFDASGTVKLGTSSTSGHVWTANDGSGNGGWAAPAACLTCVTTNTNQTITGTKTFSSNVLFSAHNTYAIGSDATRPSIVYGQIFNTPRMEIDTGSGNFYRFERASANIMDLRDNSGNLMTRWDSSIPRVSFTANVGPSADNTYSSGESFVRCSKTWTVDFEASGVSTFGGAITANGGISTASGTNSTMFVGSGNFYIRTFSGGDASCSGVTNGWIGYRTDTNELQVCNGGSVKKVSLL
jgi:hypothetical protein